MRQIPRWLARSPIGLFKVGLGRVFAGRLAMVEHIGRTSGERRYVVLEVVLDEGDGIVVASGYGAASQWYRNVQADPHVRLWWGKHTAAPATAILLAAQQSVDLLEEYRQVHPGQAATVSKGLGVPELTSDAPIPLEVGERILLVRFRLATAGAAGAAGG
ncbi:deazaflavin-dependent oxidoreductase (nitroreductase family) [Mumia flava]|uniref:Deazaflavin-dependent oxidoreductase (Nitroreductase family) n=1 Tax=Mumia flava TaxID=1348852 RepID=A0A0B2BDV9_9ACTN|nr:nitroreductase family deazaflavin-dependent oxidoreductase [Mumia flava]PJJ55930.1 deazaflavin-dependent oxidoreductase (nitroreductase family) [Mumia flava]